MQGRHGGKRTGTDRYGPARNGRQRKEVIEKYKI